jgi:peroxiredoxin
VAPSTAPATNTTPHTRVHISGEVYIGERAPDFELDASTGKPIKLSQFKGDWVLLLFDGRKEDVAKLRNFDTEARKIGVKMLGVCDEKAYNLKSFSEREQFPYPLLADPTGEISAMYGLYDGALATTGPGFVIVDRDGIVRMALLGQRLPPDVVFQLTRFAVTGL